MSLYVKNNFVNDGSDRYAGRVAILRWYAAEIAVTVAVLAGSLVVAVMRLLGDRAWWLPKWLGLRLPHVALEPSSRQVVAREW